MTMNTSTIVFSIALLLLISPAFVYMALQNLAPSLPPLQVQVASVVPFLVGAAILVVARPKPKK